MPKTPRTVTVSLPPAMAREVDRVAREEGRSRSELLREAFRQYVARKDRWDQIFAIGQRYGRDRRLTEDEVGRAVKELRRSRRR